MPLTVEERELKFRKFIKLRASGKSKEEIKRRLSKNCIDFD
jgi:hypothetical protein